MIFRTDQLDHSPGVLDRDEKPLGRRERISPMATATAVT